VTEASNQGSSNRISGVGRGRRAAAAVAVSVGMSSLVYGTSLVLPASASADTASPACSSTPTASASDSAPASASASASASPSGADATASATDTGSSGPETTATSDEESPSGQDAAAARDEASAPVTVSPSASPCSVSLSALPSTAPSSLKASSPRPVTPSTTGKGGAPTKTATSARPTIPVYTVSPTGSSYYYTSVPPGNAGYQLPTGTITRAQILTRAELWVAQQVPYSQTSWWTNAYGTYRQDCSGYVSMAWDLDQYTDFWTGNLNLVSRTIPAATLLPGDILLSVKHTILFAGWANPQHTEFDYFEEAHQGTNARYVVDAPLSAFLDNGFAPFRYDGVVDSSALPALPVGQNYALLASQGSEVDPPGVSTLQPAGLSSSVAASVTASATRSARPTVQALDEADLAAAALSRRDEGVALAVGGFFLLGAGLVMRRPIRALPRRRGKH